MPNAEIPALITTARLWQGQGKEARGFFGPVESALAFYAPNDQELRTICRKPISSHKRLGSADSV
jgi:hypothetical protein